MDLALLESLIAVAEAGTITAAAERIHLSQSALSRRLQLLEAELGADLFVRGRSGAELTEVGRQAVEHSRAIAGRWQQLRRDVDDYLGLERGSLRVGGGATATSFLLPPVIARFQAAHPGVRIYVKEAGSHEVAAGVAAGDVELGIVTLPVAARDLDVDELFVDRIVLAARPDHPLARRRVLPSDLTGQPFVAFEAGSAIRQLIDGALASAGVEAEVTMELRSIPSMLRMVAAGGLLAFVSHIAVEAEPEVTAVPIRGLSIARRLGLVSRRGPSLALPARAFAAALRQASSAPLPPG